MEEGNLPAGQFVDAALTVYRKVHEALRRDLEGLDFEAVNWRPGDGFNSIAVLVVHLVASERNVLRMLLDVPDDRDRDAEFAASADPRDLLDLLDRADSELDQARATLTAEMLATPRTRADGENLPAFHWLIRNPAHAQEHEGQVSLLRELYLARP